MHTLQGGVQTQCCYLVWLLVLRLTPLEWVLEMSAAEDTVTSAVRRLQMPKMHHAHLLRCSA